MSDMHKMILLLALSMGVAAARAQGPLDRTLSVEFRQQRLDNVLEILSNKGNFYFSYNSAILKKDSLITLTVQDKPIRQILDLIFHGNLEYKESGNYIILRRLPVRSALIIDQASPEDKRYNISGTILDEETGEKIGQASVYDPEGLAATLSDENGSFTVKIKNRHGPSSLTVSKEFYDDTTLLLSHGPWQHVTIYISPAEFSRTMITIGPGDYLSPDSIRVEPRPDSGNTRFPYAIRNLIQVELTPWGKFLLSSRLRIQSVNLKKFFTRRSFQLSFLPMLGTNGFLSPQVVNKGSLNILGGYSGGLNGAELGGLLNIDKKNVQSFQLAGLFNVVGGAVKGLQVAGIHNTVLDSLTGWQLAGISNFTKKKLRGLQVAGIYNHLGDSLEGVQLAGLLNYTRKSIRGVQVSGMVNYTRKLKGVQIGVINIADSSEGYSIGLINIVRHGFHQVSFFADEMSHLNIAFRSGNARLYSIFLAGINPGDNNRSYYYGLGLGHQFQLDKGNTWSLNPELISMRVAPGSWDNVNHAASLYKLHLDFHWRFSKYVSFSAGPSLAIWHSDRSYIVNGHTYTPPHDGYPGFSLSHKTSGWIGWQAAINFF
jgi:hypothetical protein